MVRLSLVVYDKGRPQRCASGVAFLFGAQGFSSPRLLPSPQSLMLEAMHA